MHKLFDELLSRYNLKEGFKEVLIQRLEVKWQEKNKENIELEASYRQQLKELESKIENIEESYYVTKEMGSS
jgi:hypothetical protein